MNRAMSAPVVLSEPAGAGPTISNGDRLARGDPIAGRHHRLQPRRQAAGGSWNCAMPERREDVALDIVVERLAG